MKTIKHIIIAVISLLTINSCDTIHEFPNENPTDPTIINLDLTLLLNTTMAESQYSTLMSRANASSGNHDVRFIIEVYKDYNIGNSNAPIKRFVQTYPISGSIFPRQSNSSMTLNASSYKFIIWVDCVNEGDSEDKYYQTDNLPIVKIMPPCIGSNDYKDALCGVVDIDLRSYRDKWNVTIEREIEMSYPGGKFQIITTDLERFVSKTTKSGETRSFDPNDYIVKFVYQGFVPGGYNVLSGAPTGDSETGFSFESSIVQLNNGEALLGSDIIFTNGGPTYVELVIEIYDLDNNLIHRTDISPHLRGIPIEKGKLTTVRGEFLTKDFVPGVGVNPDFDGEDTWYMDDNGNLIKK